jgi:hypothetical protein
MKTKSLDALIGAYVSEPSSHGNLSIHSKAMWETELRKKYSGTVQTKLRSCTAKKPLHELMQKPSHGLD